MNNRIRLLSEQMANLIAAGEVIERPASVVKELLENALDAGAKNIQIKIEKGGRQLISVKDDGIGMSADDALLCLERHATSKISAPDDLDKIGTLGFRGEAIPSIAAVSRMKLTTRQKNNLNGTEISIEGGKIKQVKEAGFPPGTKIDVRNLFYNTPARRKFLKSEENELYHISAHLERLVIAYPEVSFNFQHNERQIKLYPIVESLRTRIITALDSNAEDYLLPVEYQDEYCKIRGYISTPDYTKNNKQYQLTYVNHRWVKNNTLDFSLYKAYGSFVEKGKYPLAVLFIDIPAGEVDVNVHPTKREIRFRKEFEVKKRLLLALNNALSKKEVIPQVVFENDSNKTANRQNIFTQVKVDYQPGHHKYVTYKINEDAEVFKITSLKDQNKHEAYRILGQVANLYLIVEYDNGFYIIDQHAAHERVQYEKIMSEFEKGPVESQHLMYPSPLDLPTSKLELLKAYLEKLENFGFVIEIIGPDSFFIKAIPAILNESSENPRQLVYDILDELALNSESNAEKKIVSNIAASIACHSDIKESDKPPQIVIESIISALFSCQNPFVCPHGRPTLIRLTLAELAKKFKRK